MKYLKYLPLVFGAIIGYWTYNWIQEAKEWERVHGPIDI